MSDSFSLSATPDSCYWGYIDRDQQPVLEVEPGAVIEVEHGSLDSYLEQALGLDAATRETIHDRILG